jgi:hypothetical protein
VYVTIKVQVRVKVVIEVEIKVQNIITDSQLSTLIFVWHQPSSIVFNHCHVEVDD